MVAVNPGTIPALLAARAAAEPEHVAFIVNGSTTLTIGQWHERAGRAANALRAEGIQPGNRVGLVFGGADWELYAVAFAGVTAIGAVAVPLSDTLPAARIREALDHCGATFAIDRTTPLEWPTVEYDFGVGSGDLAQILYTSGTTGTPKGVAATHGNLTFGLGTLAHSRHVLHAFPVGTNAAQTMLLTALVARPTTIVQSPFCAAGFAGLADRYQVESIFVVPAMAVALLDGGHQLESVELIASSAAPLPPAVAQRLSGVYPDATILNTYTSTEAAPAFTTMTYDPARPGSVGRTGGDVRIHSTGQVWLRVPTTPRTYYGDAAATAATFAEGWIRMGDTGYLDADGYLYLTGRDDDVVKAGAHKVSTQRIEHTLYEHPAVVEAAVVGVPHPVMGSTLAAAVVARAPIDVRAFLAERVAPHEVPTRVLMLESLPRNEAGKVLKRSLVERFTTRDSSPAPCLPEEVAVAAMWTQVLGARDIGVGDDFFALGGDSLSATRLATLLAIPISEVFANPLLSAQAQLIAGSRAGPALPATGEPVLSQKLELTSTQESLLAWMYAGDVPRDAGPISVAVRVRDAFDPQRFTEALGIVVRRHDSLRMVFDGQVPSIRPDCPPVVSIVDVSGDAEAVRAVRADREGRFDLVNGPLVRAVVARLGPEDQVIGIAVHHLVFDGASMGVLLREVGLAYAGSPLPLPPVTYREHVAWTRERWAANLPYWRSVLDGAPAHLHPFTGRRHALRMRSDSIGFELGAVAPLRAYAAARGATTFMALAAVWTSVLAQVSGLRDIVLLTPVPARTRPGSESLIGCLSQSLLLRIDATAPDLLAHVRERALAALDHQYHPFAEFYQRHPGASFLRVESWGGQAHLPGLESEQFDLPRALDADWPTPDGGPDLQAPELAVVEQSDGSMRAWLLWNHYAFDRPTMEAMVRLLRDEIANHQGEQP